jgi:hypothetical protein
VSDHATEEPVVPKHRFRRWNGCDNVDEDFTDSILLRANRLIAAVQGKVCSTCIGHDQSELDSNGGQTTGGGTQYGHVQFTVPEPWQWGPTIISLSCVSDTRVTLEVRYRRGRTEKALAKIDCLICADEENLPERLRWWDRLLAELGRRTRQPS